MSSRNLANWDRMVRMGVGAVLLYLGFFGGSSGLLEATCRVFAWLPLATGLCGWSPVYAFFGWSTLSRVRSE